MKSYEIEEIKKESINLFKEACDETSLICINLDKETLKTVIDTFLDTKASKTDLNVLIKMMEFWNKETSFIYLPSFENFKIKSGIKITKGNLSRSIKSLEEKGFITKVGFHIDLEYFFKIPFQILKDSV
jgi:predicted transcriptional regulator